MRKLRSADEDALKAAFADASSPKAVKRLTMALAYLDGVSVETLSSRYDIPRSTIYAWLDRFEAESIEEALRDTPRPGRPAELDPGAFVSLSSDIADGPLAHGFDRPKWSASLLQTHITEAYGVEYSEGHARRLLRELGPDSGE